jgi:hypothetical protein
VIDFGEFLEDEFARADLMLWVHGREQVHHRDRAHAQLFEAPHARPHRILVQRQQYLALEVDPLGDRNAGPAARDRLGARRRRIPDLFLVAASQLDLVAVALGDEQSGVGTVHLDHRVVAGGGAVHDDLDLVAELGRAQAELFGELSDALHHAGALIVERGWGLVEQHFACGCDADQVGERSPDIDTQPVALGRVHEFAADDLPRRVARSRSVASISVVSVRSASDPVSTTP